MFVSISVSITYFQQRPAAVPGATGSATAAPPAPGRPPGGRRISARWPVPAALEDSERPLNKDCAHTRLKDIHNIHLYIHIYVYICVCIYIYTCMYVTGLLLRTLNS